MAPFTEAQFIDLLATILGSQREAASFWEQNKHLDQVVVLQEAQKLGKTIKAARRRRERRKEAEQRIITTGGQVVDSDKLLFTARALALCGLPHKKSKATHLVKEATLADGRQILVTFSAGEQGLPLPFGKDRTILTWMITTSRKNNNRRISFKNAKGFVKDMGLQKSGRSYREFLAAFDRITSMNCTIKFKDISGGTFKGKTTIIEQSYVPSAADMEAEVSGLQRILGTGAQPMLSEKETTAKPLSGYSELHRALNQGETVSISLKGAMHIEVDPSGKQNDEYVIVFDQNFFDEFISFPVALPFEAMKEYTDQPLIWDFIQYISYLAAEDPDSHQVIHIQELSDRLGSRDKNVRKLRMRLEPALKEIQHILPHVHFDPLSKGDNSLLVVGPAPEHLRPKLPGAEGVPVLIAATTPQVRPKRTPRPRPTLANNSPTDPDVIDAEIVD